MSESDSTASPHAPDGSLSPRAARPWAALIVLCAIQLMVILDGSIVAVALPVIGTDLDVAGSSLSWVVNAYLIPFGGVLLLAGRLGDIVGPRRVLLVGLVVFTAASALCGLASTLEVLVLARFIQGVGGALASAVVLGMIVRLFTEPNARSRALSMYAFVGAAGSAIGLIGGGILTQTLSWPWIFWINVPLGIAAVLGVRNLVPAPAGTGGRADVLGAVLVTAGLMLAVYSLLSTDATHNGGGGTIILLCALVSVGLLAAFVVRQRNMPTPLLPLRLLTHRKTGVGNLVQALMVVGLFGYQFLGVLYLQQLLGYAPLQAGLAFLPVPVVIGAVSLGLSSRLLARLGERPVLLTGLGCVAAGLALLVRLPVPASYLLDVLPAGLLIALGFGLAYPALAALAVGSAPARDSGVASGLFNTTQQLGGALGLAVLTRLATSVEPVDQAVIALGGYHLAFGAAAATAVAALLLTLPTTAPAARPHSDEPTTTTHSNHPQPSRD